MSRPELTPPELTPPELTPPELTPIEQPPPFWRRWSQLYWLVAGLLALDVIVFWLLTRWAA